MRKPILLAVPLALAGLTLGLVVNQHASAHHTTVTCVGDTVWSLENSEDFAEIATVVETGQVITILPNATVTVNHDGTSLTVNGHWPKGPGAGDDQYNTSYGEGDCTSTPDTEPPVETTEPPVETTEPPTETTEVPDTDPPVDTEPPVDTTEPPVETSEPPVVTEPPVDTDPEPTDPPATDPPSSTEPPATPPTSAPNGSVPPVTTTPPVVTTPPEAPSPPALSGQLPATR